VTTDLKLGLQLGYWTAQPPAGGDLIELAQQVEALGFDSIWTGESWSSDAFSPHRIQDLFFEGKREEAILAVPGEFADEISLVGPPARIRERIEAWRRKTPVTTLLIGSRDPEVLQLLADLTR
jgi:alkanesulfonate monooxygenase SsuD/methylene tetrahydromethanopterin reductase-like flavin-dependent oxidoreductase (luciferase family)